jgi:hypothetical protein
VNDKAKLFQYAVIYHPKPTKEQVERGERPKSELLTDLTTTLATSAEQVGILAARSISDERLGNLEGHRDSRPPFLGGVERQKNLPAQYATATVTRSTPNVHDAHLWGSLQNMAMTVSNTTGSAQSFSAAALQQGAA